MRPSKAESRFRSELAAYWSLTAEELTSLLDSSPMGLSSTEAAARSWLGLARNQIRSPLLLLLAFAAVVSGFSREWMDALIVISILLATVGIGYSREYRAQTTITALLARTRTRSTVLRDGKQTRIPLEEVVPGDVVVLVAGSIVPADAIVLEAADCHVSEAALTGESFPVEKKPGPSPFETPLARRTGSVFLGTNVQSGVAHCLVVATGAATEFGGIARRLALRPPETEFDRGLRRFGYMLTSAMLVMVLLVFVAHTLRHRPPLETLLFAIALAVGLSPELLPAILSINLARGAQLMARHGVLVRRLNAIENLGSMDILCTDKTGTLTKGVVELDGAYDTDGQRCTTVLELGALNAAFETGLPSALDDAILKAHAPDLSSLKKRAEIPFDFTRKRVSVVVSDAGGVRLVTKGAFPKVLAACSALSDGTALTQQKRTDFERLYDGWCARGVRVLGLATRELSDKNSYGRDDEVDLTFAGFLTFADRPKDGAAEAIAALRALGVSIKVISGDSELVSRHVAEQVGLSGNRVLTGAQLDGFHDEALWHEAERTDLFVEVDPIQKERIILSLKKMGHVVGFMGDGVNDAPAMHAADTSISVDQAVDVAKEAADFLLLEHDLDVIRRGIEEGRRTFANTLKYVLTTTSANLGNMVSMAAASLFLPFLPLLAGQVLLNNLLSDIPAFGVAADSVDPELIDRPRRWDMRFISRFMVEFGVLSSAFDVLTFAILLGIFRATPDVFRTGWFVESLLTELVIALVVRTRRPVFQSTPGRLLLVSTMLTIGATFAIPYLPWARMLGFVPVPASLLALLVAVTLLYIAAAELTKRWFYRTVP